MKPRANEPGIVLEVPGDILKLRQFSYVVDEHFANIGDLYTGDISLELSLDEAHTALEAIYGCMKRIKGSKRRIQRNQQTNEKTARLSEIADEVKGHLSTSVLDCYALNSDGTIHADKASSVYSPSFIERANALAKERDLARAAMTSDSETIFRKSFIGDNPQEVSLGMS